MPELSSIINGKKFMWDGEAYESEKDAQETKKKYESDDFEVELVMEEDKPLLYTRRVVTDVVVEGDPPPA